MELPKHAEDCTMPQTVRPCTEHVSNSPSRPQPCPKPGPCHHRARRSIGRVYYSVPGHMGVQVVRQMTTPISDPILETRPRNDKIDARFLTDSNALPVQGLLHLWLSLLEPNYSPRMLYKSSGAIPKSFLTLFHLRPHFLCSLQL